MATQPEHTMGMSQLSHCIPEHPDTLSLGTEAPDPPVYTVLDFTHLPQFDASEGPVPRAAFWPYWSWSALSHRGALIVGTPKP